MMFETTLSKREVEILELVARGYSNKAISEALDIRLQTVKNHLSNIFAKLGVNRRLSAARAHFAGTEQYAAPLRKILDGRSTNNKLPIHGAGGRLATVHPARRRAV